MKNLFAFWAILFSGCLLPVFSQKNAPLSQPEKPGLQAQKANHSVESKVECVQISNFKYEDSSLIVTMKNICQDNIATMRIRAGNSSSMLPIFKIESGKEKDFSISINGYMVEQGFIAEAVLFENGQGSGERDKVESLQMVFLGSINELEKIQRIIAVALENLSDNPKNDLAEIKKQIELMPENYVDFKKVGMGGVMLFSGRSTYWGRITELELHKEAANSEFIFKELQKIKTDIEKTIESYPKVTKP